MTKLDLGRALRGRKPVEESDEELLKRMNEKEAPPAKTTGKRKVAPAEATDGTKRMNIFLPLGIHRRLKGYAGTSGKTMNDIIIDLVMKHLDGEDCK